MRRCKRTGDLAQKHTYVKKWRLAQVAKRQSWQTHPGAVNPLPQRDQARAKTQVGPRSKNPSYPGVDLHIAQLHREGVVGTTQPQMHPCDHFSLMKRLDPAVEKGLQDLYAC
jgi:hypothetical protein